MAGRKKGTPKTGGRKKGTPNKVDARARDAIALLIESRIDQLSALLDEVKAADGPGAAWNAFTSLFEYHLPKLARLEHAGDKDQPVELVLNGSDVDG